jgi:PIN domain nuclease of toxin-antitoxin system
MEYLLDTHTLIWYVEDVPKLSLLMRSEIDDDTNSTYICIASLWEIAIKVNLGKLKLKVGFNEFLDNVKMRDFGILQIEDRHLRRLANLPILHRDPFDRMIISTALVEGLTIITVDEDIRKYDVSWAW